MLVHSILVMQLLNAVNADSHRHHLMVFCEQVLRRRRKPQLAIRRKADSRERCKRNLAAVALREPVITDSLNQLGFK